jgi:P2 family phage contractile tail tube protein
MTNKVAEKTISYRVYNDAKDLLGTADVQLPDLQSLSETVKGAGIAGEIDVPTMGMYASMQMSINWTTMNANLFFLSKPMAHQLTLRGAVQVYDAGAGTFSTVAQKVVVKAVPKKTSLGKLDTGAKQESGSEFEISYIKVWIDEKEVFELDKYNFICVIDGEDVLADTRKALGLE